MFQHCKSFELDPAQGQHFVSQSVYARTGVLYANVRNGRIFLESVDGAEYHKFISTVVFKTPLCVSDVPLSQRNNVRTFHNIYFYGVKTSSVAEDV